MAYQIEREYQELTQAMLKYNDPFWWLTVVFKEAGFTEVERNPNDVALSIELSYYNNYYEDMILELLNTLVPFTAEGFISYRGEKGDLWCHVFAGGEWTERSGRICYDEPRPQFEESKQNLARLIEEIRRQVIYDDRPYEDRARDLLKAFEAHDPDGVLLALSAGGSVSMESLPLFGRTAEKVRILMRASKSRIKKCGLGCFSARAASVMMNSASKTILEWRVLVWRAKMCRKLCR